MFKSLKSKLIFPIVGVLVFIFALVVVYVTISTRNLSEDLTDERIATASRMVHTYIQSLDELNRMRAYGISGSPRLAELVLAWSALWEADQDVTAVKLEIDQYLSQRRGEFGLDSFVVLDYDGIVILRSFDVPRYGDSLRASAHISAALAGNIYTVTSVTAVLPIGFSTAAPIYHEGVIIGAISCVVSMYTNEFVDSISESFNADVTIYARFNDVVARRSTTFRTAGGARALDVELDQSIIEYVLDQNRHLTTEVDVDGAPYSMYYFPMHGWGDVPVGIFSVGFSNADTIAATNTVLRNTTLIGVGGLLIAALIMFFLITRSLTPLGKLARNVKLVTAGVIKVLISSVSMRLVMKSVS